jgi:hypothetical protein
MAPALVKVKAKLINTGVDSDTGLSDNDKTKGNEQEAAVNSPPKGKKRATSAVGFYFHPHCYINDISLCLPIQGLIVQKPSKVGETTSKKAQIEELPDYVNAKWFRKTFIPTYMAYVNQVMNPWEVPAKLAVEKI